MRKYLFFSLLACSGLVMGIAFAADYEAYIVSTPVAQENAGAEPEVAIFMWDPLESTCRHASLSIL